MDSKELEDLFREINASDQVKPTLTQISAITDDVEFANQIVVYVCDSVVEGRALRPPERIVGLVADCEYRLLRGGITDFLFQAHEPAAAIEALVTIGRSRVAGILRRGLDWVDAIPPERAAGRTIGELTDLAGAERLADLKRQLGDVFEIGEALRVWIARHRSAFAVD